MNFLILITLITLILNQVICESFNDDTEKQRKNLKYYLTHSSEIDSSSRFNLPDYYYCRKVLNTFEPIGDLIYSNSISRNSKTADRLNKRLLNNDLMNKIDDYKTNNYQEEMIHKLVTRKSDDPKIFRNLFLGSRG